MCLIIRDNECNSKTNQNKTKKTGFEECQVAPRARPEKGQLTPEVKTDNEIICDHVWEKLLSLPPISVI
jgi:hypothetical protein